MATKNINPRAIHPIPECKEFYNTFNGVLQGGVEKLAEIIHKSPKDLEVLGPHGETLWHALAKCGSKALKLKIAENKEALGIRDLLGESVAEVLGVDKDIEVQLKLLEDRETLKMAAFALSKSKYKVVRMKLLSDTEICRMTDGRGNVVLWNVYFASPEEERERVIVGYYSSLLEGH